MVRHNLLLLPKKYYPEHFFLNIQQYPTSKTDKQNPVTKLLKKVQEGHQ